MTGKEKDAIETMQHWIDYEKANKEKINKADELIEIQETVLNLIQTQQEEINDLKWRNEIYVKSIKSHKSEIEKYKIQLAEVFANTVNSDLKQKHKHEEDLETLNLGWKAELEKKDEIIDEMASFIGAYELDEEISKTYCDGTLDNCKHKEDAGTCRACIKEYFINKVEEEN